MWVTSPHSGAEHVPQTHAAGQHGRVQRSRGRGHSASRAWRQPRSSRLTSLSGGPRLPSSKSCPEPRAHDYGAQPPSGTGSHPRRGRPAGATGSRRPRAARLRSLAPSCEGVAASSWRGPCTWKDPRLQAAPLPPRPWTSRPSGRETHLGPGCPLLWDTPPAEHISRAPGCRGSGFGLGTAGTPLCSLSPHPRQGCPQNGRSHGAGDPGNARMWPLHGLRASMPPRWEGAS